MGEFLTDGVPFEGERPIRLGSRAIDVLVARVYSQHVF
jgi:hypothetical protein